MHIDIYIYRRIDIYIIHFFMFHDPFGHTPPFFTRCRCVLIQFLRGSSLTLDSMQIASCLICNTREERRESSKKHTRSLHTNGVSSILVCYTP